MRDENNSLGYLGLVVLIAFIGIFLKSCWSGSVADNDIHSHRYIVVAGKYYPTEDIDYIDTDVVFHDKNVITIHFKDGVTYQTQEGQYVFAEDIPDDVMKNKGICYGISNDKE